ncbi:MAG: hypothetical protein N2423_10075 [Novosphingobium sp.]|nr:hypothetical protein [Novosphingobium sp.]
MGIAVVFLLGIGNFAIHKAVLESGHPLLARLPWLFYLLGGHFSLLVEFFVLLGAMLMAGAGSVAWVWAYVGYSILNAISAWLMLSGRV